MIFDWTGELTPFYRREIAAAALQLAAGVVGVDLEQTITARGRSKAVYARQLAMYLCHVVADMSLRDVADAFGRDRTTASHACHALEDRRENPIFDRQIEHLERALRSEIRRIVEAASPTGFETKSFALLRYA